MERLGGLRLLRRSNKGNGNRFEEPICFTYLLFFVLLLFERHIGNHHSVDNVNNPIRSDDIGLIVGDVTQESTHVIMQIHNACTTSSHLKTTRSSPNARLKDSARGEVGKKIEGN